MLELDNFRLEEFDDTDIVHLRTVTNLDNDEQVQKYFGTMNIQIKYAEGKSAENGIDTAYVAFYNDEAIGMIILNFINEKTYEISYAILKEYRNEYLASLLLQEFSEKIFEIFPKAEELNLLISNINTGSRKVANLVGYKREGNTNYYTMKR